MPMKSPVQELSHQVGAEHVAHAGRGSLLRDPEKEEGWPASQQRARDPSTMVPKPRQKKEAAPPRSRFGLAFSALMSTGLPRRGLSEAERSG